MASHAIALPPKPPTARRPSAAGAAAVRPQQRRAASTAAGLHWRRAAQPAVCTAAIEQEPSSRPRHRAASANGHGAPGGSSSSSSRGRGSTAAGSLLQRIAQCGTAGQLHELLCQHRSQLGPREVAAALEVAANRKLAQQEARAAGQGQQGGGGAAASSAAASGDGRPLCGLLVQLASEHVAAMEPPTLAAAAWSLAAMQLAAAAPVLRAMHAQAEAQLVLFSPSQLCALLWAGGRLDPSFRSPLFQSLLGLLRQGLSLALFAPHDLAVLAWLCGREGGSPAKDVLIMVADECRARVERYNAAVHGAAAAAAGGPAAGAAAAAAPVAGAKRSGRRRPEGEGGGQAAEQPPPPPPFGPTDAAMLLTGLARHQLRVGGVAEPILQQCRQQLDGARPADVVQIIGALGELDMEIAAELYTALLRRFSEAAPELSPRQVANTLWAIARVNGKFGCRQITSTATKHYSARRNEYRTADTICLLWAVAQYKGTMPDELLGSALRAVQPELQQCSVSSLTNLVWALGKLQAAWRRRPRAAAQACATAEAALAELARRAPRLPHAELAAAASAAATYASAAASSSSSSSSAGAGGLGRGSSAQLPQLAALRDACAAAVAAGNFRPADLAHLAIAASRLGWSERTLLDPLAASLQSQVEFQATHGELYVQLVRALALLAPGRYTQLFHGLAQTYIKRQVSSRRLEGRFATSPAAYDFAERSSLLGSFAAVASVQGLPQPLLLQLVGTVRPSEAGTLTPGGVVALAALAALAGLEPSSPMTLACIAAIRKHFRRMSLEELRNAEAALIRLRCDASNLLPLLQERAVMLLAQGDP